MPKAYCLPKYIIFTNCFKRRLSCHTLGTYIFLLGYLILMLLHHKQWHSSINANPSRERTHNLISLSHVISIQYYHYELVNHFWTYITYALEYMYLVCEGLKTYS